MTHLYYISIVSITAIESRESFLKGHGCPVDMLTQILKYKTQDVGK